MPAFRAFFFHGGPASILSDHHQPGVFRKMRHGIQEDGQPFAMKTGSHEKHHKGILGDAKTVAGFFLELGCQGGMKMVGVHTAVDDVQFFRCG